MMCYHLLQLEGSSMPDDFSSDLDWKPDVRAVEDPIRYRVNAWEKTSLGMMMMMMVMVVVVVMMMMMMFVVLMMVMVMLVTAVVDTTVCMLYSHY